MTTYRITLRDRETRTVGPTRTTSRSITAGGSDVFAAALGKSSR